MSEKESTEKASDKNDAKDKDMDANVNIDDDYEEEYNPANECAFWHVSDPLLADGCHPPVLSSLLTHCQLEENQIRKTQLSILFYVTLLTAIVSVVTVP